jgi:hypothetical protein
MLISSGAFEATRQSKNGGNLLNFHIRKDGLAVSNGQVLDLWCEDELFRDFYCSLIKDSGFHDYAWETPAISIDNLNEPFEFVLINAPTSNITPDQKTFEQFFDIKGGDCGVVSFDNLPKDALLVVPSPIDQHTDYSNLSAFSRSAPKEQQHALWRTVGRSARQRLSQEPMWLSVAGGGVAWLHIRLDSRPKYYRHAPYRLVPTHS